MLTWKNILKTVMEGRKLDEQRKVEFKEIEGNHMRDKSVRVPNRFRNTGSCYSWQPCLSLFHLLPQLPQNLG